MAHVDRSHRAQWLKSIYFISFQRCSTQIDRWNDSNWRFVQMYVFRCFLRSICVRPKNSWRVRQTDSQQQWRPRTKTCSQRPHLFDRFARNEHEAAIWPSRHTSLYYLFAECELVNWRAATAVRKQMSLVIPWIKCDFLHVFFVRGWFCRMSSAGAGSVTAVNTFSVLHEHELHFYGQSTIRKRAVFPSVGILSTIYDRIQGSQKVNASDKSTASIFCVDVISKHGRGASTKPTRSKKKTKSYEIIFTVCVWK